jgi:hypothetical protein
MESGYTITAELWLHPGQAGWHFVTLPPDVADDVRARSRTRPFGTVRATVTLGATTWSTSLFADTARASYLLPIKADLRRRERIGDGDTVTLTLTLDR